MGEERTGMRKGRGLRKEEEGGGGGGGGEEGERRKGEREKHGYLERQATESLSTHYKVIRSLDLICSTASWWLHICLKHLDTYIQITYALTKSRSRRFFIGVSALSASTWRQFQWRMAWSKKKLVLMSVLHRIPLLLVL